MTDVRVSLSVIRPSQVARSSPVNWTQGFTFAESPVELFFMKYQDAAIAIMSIILQAIFWDDVIYEGVMQLTDNFCASQFF